MAVHQLLALLPETLAALAPGSTPGVTRKQSLIPLRAVFGQDEANHGTARFPVDAEGLVWVPAEAVEPLTERGGFAMPETMDQPLSAGMVKLHHSDAGGCSLRGRSYPVDESGNVLVPAEAAYELLAHGFMPVPSGPAPAFNQSKPSPVNRSKKG
jgi:hypothetical protein